MAGLKSMAFLSEISDVQGKIAQCASVYSQIFWGAGVHQKFFLECCDPQQCSAMQCTHYAFMICYFTISYAWDYSISLH